MLRDATAASSPDGIAHAAPRLRATTSCRASRSRPSKLTDLRLLYGSCRRPGHRDPDAMVWIDDQIADHVGDPRGRPHQLFLGGDQIYADDVDTLMMLQLMDARRRADRHRPDRRRTIETAFVDQIVRKRAGAPDPTQATPPRRLPARHHRREATALPGRQGPLPRRPAPRPHPAGRQVHQQRRQEPPHLARRVRRHVPAGVEQRLLGRRHPRRHVRAPTRRPAATPQPLTWSSPRHGRSSADQAAAARRSRRAAAPSPAVARSRSGLRLEGPDSTQHSRCAAATGTTPRSSPGCPGCGGCWPTSRRT